MAIERIGEGMVDLSLIRGGPFQARQNNVDVDVDELASNIRIQGLFKPVMLVEVEKDATYELIDGQRRFLAFKILCKKEPEKFSKIPCFLYKNIMEDWEKKSASFMANMSSKPMDKYDRINSATIIYKHFNNIQMTAQATGMSESTIRKYVQLSRLPDELQAEIKENHITMSAALDTADLLGYDRGNPTGVDINEMVQTALDLQKLNKTQKGYVRELKEHEPKKPVKEIIGKVVSIGVSTQNINITVISDTYDRIERYKEQNEVSSISGATVDLVEDGLAANDM